MRQRAVLLMSLWMLQVLVSVPLVPPAVADEEVAPAVVEQHPADAWILSVDECIQIALENNLDIAVSRFDPRRSETRVTFQESVFDPLLTGSATSLQDEDTFHRLTFNPATQLPVGEFEFPRSTKGQRYAIGFEDPLTLGGSYRIDIRGSDLTFLSTEFGVAASTFTSAAEEFRLTWNLTFTQPLLRNLGPRANTTGIVVATNNLEIGESQFRQIVLDSVAAAEQAYWELNFTLMELRTVLASLDQAKDFLEQNRIKVRVGTLAPIEITQAEADVADREQSLIIAEFAILAAEDELRRVLGISWDSPQWSRPIRPADAPPLDVVTPDLQGMQELAAQNRPDLEQARLDIQSREAELYFTQNQRRWALDFQGVLGGKGVSGILTNSGFSGARDDLGNQDDWSLSLNLSVPIRNREAIANYTDAKYALDQSQVALQRAGQLALVEVRNAVRRVATDLKRVNAAEVNTRLQREKLEAEEKKFQNGMSTSFEVLTFQTDLRRAETVQNRAIVDYNKSQVELERVTGTLLTSRGIVVPSASGEDESGSQSAALRSLWRSTPTATLHLADTSDYTVALPPGFSLSGADVVPLDLTR